MAPGPGMLVDCTRCGGAHRFCNPCPPVGEFSRMLPRLWGWDAVREAMAEIDRLTQAHRPRAPVGDREWGGS